MRRGPFRAGQHGAAAVEFAFVFPMLFLLVYGVVVYSYLYLVQESLSYAAQEATEAAVAVDPERPGGDDIRRANARATAVSALSWLPAAQRERVLGSAGEKVQVDICSAGTGICPPDDDAVTVTLTFEVRMPESLFPVLNLYIVGSVPPLPETLVAKATALI